jgi:hypothetical protein
MGIAENAVRYLCPMTKRDDQYTQALLREVAAQLSGVGGVHCRGRWMCGRYAGLQSPSQKFPQRYLVSSVAVSHLGEEKLSRGKGIAQGVVSTVARKVVRSLRACRRKSPPLYGMWRRSNVLLAGAWVSMVGTGRPTP